MPSSYALPVGLTITSDTYMRRQGLQVYCSIAKRSRFVEVSFPETGRTEGSTRTLCLVDSNLAKLLTLVAIGLEVARLSN
jgi:hypothetical protein